MPKHEPTGSLGRFDTAPGPGNTDTVGCVFRTQPIVAGACLALTDGGHFNRPEKNRPSGTVAGLSDYSEMPSRAARTIIARLKYWNRNLGLLRAH